MSITIQTLIPDVQSFLKERKPWTLSEIKFNESPRRSTLGLSQMGPKCPCALWHSVHKPELAEPLPPDAIFKYDYGHIIEAAAKELARRAGHTVEGEQDEIFVDGIAGHRDCVIDGCLVDVKSAATRSFQKFKDGSIRLDDSFGYLDQLDGYMVGSLTDPIVKVKDRAYLWVIDKQLGHQTLYEHFIREDSIRARVRDAKRIVSLSEPPACTCGTIPDGESGNIRLDLQGSYNAYKYCCKPFVRTFLYSDGPRYLTKVIRRPKRKDGTLIPEVDRHGKTVYN